MPVKPFNRHKSKRLNCVNSSDKTHLLSCKKVCKDFYTRRNSLRKFQRKMPVKPFNRHKFKRLNCVISNFYIRRSSLRKFLRKMPVKPFNRHKSKRLNCVNPTDQTQNFIFKTFRLCQTMIQANFHSN